MKKLMISGVVFAVAFTLLFASCSTEPVEKGIPTNYDSGSSPSSNSGGNTSDSTTGDIKDSYVNTKYSGGETDSRRASQTDWQMANCHDPKLFQDDDGTYYVYATDASCGNIGNVGIHIRYSKDLVNWTGVATSALAGYWDEELLRWEDFTASSSETKQNNSSYVAYTWAPTVVKLNGLYYMYHGVNADVGKDANGRTRPASAIVLAIASNAKGPFYPANFISSYAAGSDKKGNDADILKIKAKLNEIGVSYTQSFLARHIRVVPITSLSRTPSLDGKSLSNPDYTSSDYKKSNNTRFGCIDPEFVYDVATGKLMEYQIGENECYALIYGSWMSGISLVYVDKVSLKPVANMAFTYNEKSYSVGDELDISLDEANTTQTSGSYGLCGVRIAGGYSAGYEGAQLFFNSDTNYYYLITSCGGLDYEYRCTCSRSVNIEGEYIDAGGKSVLLSGDNYSSYHAYGSKIIGSHALDGEYSFRCQGGLSIWRNTDGQIIFACHARTNFQMGYYFYLQCHQMFFNEDGWPVLNQNEFYPDYKSITVDGKESLSKLTVSEVAGDYNTILTVRGAETAAINTLGIFGASDISGSANKADAVPTESKKMTLYENGSIGSTDGNYSGNWTLSDDGYSITLTLENGDGVALGKFKGFVLNAVDWAVKGGASAKRRTLTFTTLCYDSTGNSQKAGEYFWGNRTGDATGTPGVKTTYADRYASATLQATYTLTISDSAKNDLAWYLYPQYGSWSYVVDDGSGETDSEFASGADSWWAGQDGHISTKHVIPDGGTLIFYTGTTASNGTLVIEGYSSVAETYADIDPHTVDNGWGDAVSVWGTNDSRTKIGYEAQNLKIVITRNGTTQIVKIYKK